MTKKKHDDVKLLECIKKAKRVYIIGNGGSAANANHIANDLFSCGIKAHSLTADVSTLTAIGNDFGYEHIFSRQIKVFGEPGDLLIALSGSGNSPNIVNAIIEAHTRGVDVFAITGAWQKNKIEDIVFYIVKHGKNMQAAEDYQLTLIHKVYRTLKGLK